MARHRKLRGRRLKRQKRIILATIISLTLILSTGYAAFSTNLTLNAKGNAKYVAKISPIDLTKPENIKPSTSTESGLYVDTNETDSNDNPITRYIYKGNPDNYINIKENGTNQLYRIYSIESDGTMKVIRNMEASQQMYDNTSRKGGYCTDVSRCNAWAAMDSFTNGSYTGAVSADSLMKEYLEGTYASSLDDYDKIVSKTWNISGINYNDDSLTNTIANEKVSTWDGKIALLTASEYVRANSNTESCGTLALLWNNRSACLLTNYLVNTNNNNIRWWLLSPDSGSRIMTTYVYPESHVGYTSTSACYRVRPVFYLSSDIKLKGEGTASNPYQIA